MACDARGSILSACWGMLECQHTLPTRPPQTRADAPWGRRGSFSAVVGIRRRQNGELICSLNETHARTGIPVDENHDSESVVVNSVNRSPITGHESRELIVRRNEFNAVILLHFDSPPFRELNWGENGGVRPIP